MKHVSLIVMTLALAVVTFFPSVISGQDDMGGVGGTCGTGCSPDNNGTTSTLIPMCGCPVRIGANCACS